jgi:hypothetical protein
LPEVGDDQVAGGCELHGFRQASAEVPPTTRQVVRRAGGGSQRLHFFHEELLETSGVEKRLCLLVQIGLVGGAAPLGHEQELVFHPVGGVQVDLGRKIAAGIDLIVQVQGTVWEYRRFSSVWS